MRIHLITAESPASICRTTRRVNRATAGEYEVSVTMAPGTSVADIQQAGRSVFKEGIIVGEEPSEPLRLILDSAKRK